MTQLNNHNDDESEGGCSELDRLLSPRLFRALSDPTRIALLVRLAHQDSPRTVGALADGSGVDLSVVSRHLAVLRDAGILESRRRGREVLCSLKCREVAGVLRALADALERCSAGDQ